MGSIPHASGIYQILCVPTGKIYIGSTVNIARRWLDHRKHLNGNKHINRHLQAAWNKYGADVFEFSVIELVFDVYLVEREQYWLDRLKPFGKCGFNICINAASPLGITRTAEHRAKLSVSTRIRMSDPEQRAAVSRVHKGKTISAHHREQMRLGRVRQNKSAKARAAVVEKNARDYVLTSPDGIEYHVHNLKEFCIPLGLNSSALCAVANRKRNHHKGWICRYK